MAARRSSAKKSSSRSAARSGARRPAASGARRAAAARGGGAWGRKALVAVLLLGLAGGGAWFAFGRRPDGPAAAERPLAGARDRAGQLARNLARKGGELEEDLRDLAPAIVENVRETVNPTPEEPGTLEEPIIIARVTRALAGNLIEIETAGERDVVRLARLQSPAEIAAAAAGAEASRVEALEREALHFARLRLEGRQARLEFEKAPPRRDAQGNRLCYVHLGERNYGVDLVAEGLARFAPPDASGAEGAYDSALRSAQERARKARLGLWAPPALAASARP